MHSASALSSRFDVLIAGGGFVGLGLAIALRRGLGPSFAVAVADPAFVAARPGPDARASAIVPAVRRLLDAIGVWDRVAAAAQPVNDMVVTDSRLDDVMRPHLLTFGDDLAQPELGLPGEPVAHMVENEGLLAALLAEARAAGVTLLPAGVLRFDAIPDVATVHLDSGEIVAARLVVAADGARSRLRARAGIAIHGWSYGQAAIATTIAHERDHGGRAEEHFLPAGPFAILPLTGRRSSIVWTESVAEAERLMALPPQDFHSEVERRFGLRLGEIEVVLQPRMHRLEFFVARSFVADRLALIGDAAHVIHPIAGQGLNLGFKDVAALAECIADAARLGLDIGSAEVLDRYQRWRRFDTMAMGVVTDGLNRLFSNDIEAVRAIRDFGLGLVERAPRLKRAFIREASGDGDDTPRLLRGEMV